MIRLRCTNLWQLVRKNVRHKFVHISLKGFFGTIIQFLQYVKKFGSQDVYSEYCFWLEKKGDTVQYA